jgi:hypothetical protein
MNSYKMSTNKPLDFVGLNDKVWNIYKKAVMPCDDVMVANGLTETKALEVCELLNEDNDLLIGRLFDSKETV